MVRSILSLFSLLLAGNAQVPTHPVEITIFNFHGPHGQIYQELLNPELAYFGSPTSAQVLSNLIPQFVQTLPALPAVSTNEVRGPISLPVEQDAQPDHIIVHAEDELDTPHWSYSGPTGPDYWPKIYPECGGKSQSPINIQPYMTYQRPTNPIMAENYNRLYPAFIVKGKKNVDISFEGPKQMPWIAGGYIPYGESYQFAGLHMHWGSKNNVGSEHRTNLGVPNVGVDKLSFFRVEGFEFPGEAHFVHFNRKYGNLTNAVDKPDGLLVLGFFLQLAEKSGPGISVIADGIRSLNESGNNEVDIGKLSIDAILGHIPLVEYFFYQGSLTTPPCSENVLWHVFSTPIQISQRDLDAFRNLKNEDGKSYSDNNRPVLPLNGREVLRNVLRRY